MQRETILETTTGAVTVLTMNRPTRRNAFNSQQYCELRDALGDALADDRVRAVVITGSPGAFSAGQDMSEMIPTGNSGDGHGFATFMDRLCSFDKPLLAAVNGVGVGLGLTMCLHCDIVYIADSARLRCPFVSLGVVPEAGSSLLLPLVAGYQRAAEVLLTAEWIDAERAVALGIAARRLPDAELLPATLAKAAEIARHPLGALRHTKRLLLATRADALRDARAREDAAFAERIGSPENLEAVRAFLEKRAPDFGSKPS